MGLPGAPRAVRELCGSSRSAPCLGYNLKLNPAIGTARGSYTSNHVPITGVRSARRVGGSRRISSREAPI